MTSEIETVWYRHRENGSLHEAEKGSEAHRRLQSERTVVDEGAGEVPESVFERVSAGEVKKAADNPEKQPGFHKPVKRGPRRGQVVVEVAAGETSGPSEAEREEFAKRIAEMTTQAAEEAAKTAVEQFAADLAELKAAEDAKAAADAAQTTKATDTHGGTPKATKAAEPAPKKD